MTPIEKAASAFINLFLAEVGYHEKASNAQLESPTANSGSANWNKFAAHIDSLRAKGLNFYNGRKNGYDWCDISFDDTMIRFCQSLGLDELEAAKLAMQMLYQPSDSCGAGCEFSADYYRAAGAWIERGGEPKTGDQFFSGPRGKETHTGAVVRTDSVYVYTVEGNANNQVMERRYDRSDGNIAGYGRPNFALVAYKFVDDDTPIQDDEEEINMEEVKKLIAARKPTRDEIMEATGDQWIGKFTDLPPWAKKEVRELIEMGAIKGTKLGKTVEETEINASLNSYIRPCIVALRVAKKVMGDAPKDALAAQMERVVEFLRGDTE